MEPSLEQAYDDEIAALKVRISTLEKELIVKEAALGFAKNMLDAMHSTFTETYGHVERLKSATMVKTIWFMWRPDEERTYAFTAPPQPYWLEKQRAEGYNLVSFEVRIPVPRTESLGLVELPVAH